MLPAKLRLPMTAENAIAMTSFTGAWPGRGASRWYSAAATSAAAPPPTPLNSATICGIAVILTLRAPTTPITAPIDHRDGDRPKLTIALVDERRDDRDAACRRPRCGCRCVRWPATRAASGR